MFPYRLRNYTELMQYVHPEQMHRSFLEALYMFCDPKEVQKKESLFPCFWVSKKDSFLALFLLFVLINLPLSFFDIILLHFLLPSSLFCTYLSSNSTDTLQL
jgi:hypothetical protein